MSKKNFSGGLKTLLGEEAESLTVEELAKDYERPKRGKKRTLPKRQITKQSQAGLHEGITRATFIVKESDLEKFKTIAFWERRQIKDITEEAISQYIANYEKKHGKLKPRPEGK